MLLEQLAMTKVPLRATKKKMQLRWIIRLKKPRIRPKRPIKVQQKKQLLH